ncbi:MAG: hypothetical protein LBH48_04800, partial [Bifidobacteriaceae bacterium]|nr:hypothetical protein [Bifidobacteriaceae bacterium]
AAGRNRRRVCRVFNGSAAKCSPDGLQKCSIDERGQAKRGPAGRRAGQAEKSGDESARPGGEAGGAAGGGRVARQHRFERGCRRPRESELLQPVGGF